jgi:putative serine protease PepD
MKIKNEFVNEIIVEKRKNFSTEAFLLQVSVQEEEQREMAMFQDEKTFYIGDAQAGTRNAATGALLDRPASSSPADYTAQTPIYAPQQPYTPYTPAFQPPEKPEKSKRGIRTGAIIALTFVLLLVFGVGLFAGWQFSGTSKSVASTQATSSAAGSSTTSAAVLQAQQVAAIATIEPSVVELDVTVAQGEQIGSGVIVDAQGDIVTNNHVINGGQTISVMLNSGKVETGQVVGTDAAHDLAVVRIQPFAHMAVASIGDSSQLKVGQAVLAVGNPLGITETATHGIVSALNRTISESASVTITNAIQTDAAINPGNSGGALINLQGQLVGIPTLAAINTESNTPASGVGFAIPSNLVKTALTQILQK